MRFHYLTFFDPGFGVGVLVSVSVGGGSCRMETAKKGEKYGGVAALMHSWTCTAI